MDIEQLHADVARLKTQVSRISMFMMGVPLSVFALFVFQWWQSYTIQ
jgi:hypothetical protein